MVFAELVLGLALELVHELVPEPEPVPELELVPVPVPEPELELGRPTSPSPFRVPLFPVRKPYAFVSWESLVLRMKTKLWKKPWV